MPSDLLRHSRLSALLETGAARSVRQAHGLTLSVFAAEIGVTPAALSRWELGQRRPRRASALRYLDALEQLTGRGARGVAGDG
jgi:transcriptional regulator with XRE-family HTH domain